MKKNPNHNQTLHGKLHYFVLFCNVPTKYKLFKYIHNWVLGLIAFNIDVCWITFCWIGKAPKEVKVKHKVQWQKMINS
jgi:hypothetical protein